MFLKSRSENSFAVFCLLFSATMWGLIWYPLRLLDDAGMSGIWSSLVMYFAAAILSVPVLFRQRLLFQQHQKILLSLATAAGIANVAFILALIEGEVMRVMLLFYLSPIWSVILGRWWLQEKLSSHAVMLFALAMLGSVIMLWNPDMGFPWPTSLADVLAVIAGMAFAMNNVIARKLAELPLTLKTGVTWWGVVFISLLVIVWQGKSYPDTTILVWLGAWSLGWLGIILMTLSVLYGVARMPVYRSAVIMLFELIVAAIGASLLTDEVMRSQEWLGGCLILVAAYGVARISHKNEQAV
jgi:drug/metabolite transporter (DMT)-like permease